MTETTALGAAYLAGLARDLCPAPEDFAKAWALNHRFQPQMEPALRDARYARWKKAVEAVMMV